MRQVGARPGEAIPAHGDAGIGGRQRTRQEGSSCVTWSPAQISSHSADAVVLATGGYGNAYYLSTYGRGSNATAIWRAYKKGRSVRQPVFHPNSSDVHSRVGRLSVQAHADERVVAQRRPCVGPEEERRQRSPAEIPEDERDYYLERKYPSYGNLAPRDISSRAAKQVCDEGRGVGESGLGVYLDFSDAIKRLGGRRSKSVTEISSTCTTRSRTRTRTRPRCAFFPRSTTRWAGCGSITI